MSDDYGNAEITECLSKVFGESHGGPIFVSGFVVLAEYVADDSDEIQMATMSSEQTPIWKARGMLAHAADMMLSAND